MLELIGSCDGGTTTTATTTTAEPTTPRTVGNTSTTSNANVTLRAIGLRVLRHCSVLDTNHNPSSISTSVTVVDDFALLVDQSLFIARFVLFFIIFYNLFIIALIIECIK